MASLSAQELIRVFEAAVAADPKDAQSHVGLGRAYLSLNDAPKARAAFERVLQLVPGYAEAVSSLARLDFLAGDRGALERLRQAAAAPSTAFFEQLYLGQSLADVGDLPGATAALEKALAAAPDNPFALLELANVSLLKKEAGRASHYAMRAADLVPKQLMPWLMLARALVQEGRLGEALTRLLSTAAAFPTSPAVFAEIFDVAMIAGNVKAAVGAAGELRRLAPSADSTYKHGLALLLADKVPEARAALEEAVKEAPNAPEPKQALAKCLLATKDEAGALQVLAQANQAAPKDSGAANDLAMLLLKKNDSGAAVKVLLPVLSANPKDEAANLNVALAYVQQGKKKDAVPHVQAVLTSANEAIRKQAEQLKGMVGA